jgi:hypothetical protein
MHGFESKSASFPILSSIRKALELWWQWVHNLHVLIVHLYLLTIVFCNPCIPYVVTLCSIFLQSYIWLFIMSYFLPAGWFQIYSASWIIFSSSVAMKDHIHVPCILMFSRTHVQYLID